MTAPHILIIGYGNTLRSDDGIGYQVAEAIASWAIPQVKALAVHQLTPELVAEMAQVQWILFIDAAAIASSVPDVPEIQVERLQLDGPVAFTTHVTTPSALLALAKRLYQVEPIAYQIKIPGICFVIGETLSTIGIEGKNATLAYLKVTLQEGLSEQDRIPATIPFIEPIGGSDETPNPVLEPTPSDGH